MIAGVPGQYRTRFNQNEVILPSVLDKDEMDRAISDFQSIFPEQRDNLDQLKEHVSLHPRSPENSFLSLIITVETGKFVLIDDFVREMSQTRGISDNDRLWMNSVAFCTIFGTKDHSSLPISFLEGELKGLWFLIGIRGEDGKNGTFWDRRLALFWLKHSCKCVLSGNEEHVNHTELLPVLEQILLFLKQKNRLARDFIHSFLFEREDSSFSRLVTTIQNTGGTLKDLQSFIQAGERFLDDDDKKRNEPYSLMLQSRFVRLSGNKSNPSLAEQLARQALDKVREFNRSCNSLGALQGGPVIPDFPFMNNLA